MDAWPEDVLTRSQRSSITALTSSLKLADIINTRTTAALSFEQLAGAAAKGWSLMLHSLMHLRKYVIELIAT